MQSNDIFPIYLFIVHVERETMMFTCFWASLGNELTWSLDLGGATQKKKYENERGSFSGGCLRTRRVTNVWEKKKKFCFWIQKRGIKPVFSPICIFIKVCVCVCFYEKASPFHYGREEAWWRLTKTCFSTARCTHTAQWIASLWPVFLYSTSSYLGCKNKTKKLGLKYTLEKPPKNEVGLRHCCFSPRFEI